MRGPGQNHSARALEAVVPVLLTLIMCQFSARSTFPAIVETKTSRLFDMGLAWLCHLCHS